MPVYVGKRGLIRRMKNKKYFGYKVYGRSGMRYSRNKKISRILWGK